VQVGGTSSCCATATRTDEADTNPLNLKDISEQRQLTDEGRAQARAMGDAMRKLRCSELWTPACHRLQYILCADPGRCGECSRDGGV
jgi:phosphohistidine phosphatase SixA